MEKILHRTEPDKSNADYLFWCPGCKSAHGVWTEKRNGLTQALWSFNGDEACPTFAPSILVRGVDYPPKDPATGDFQRGPDGKYLLGPDGRLLGVKDVVCHSYVRNGHIEFLPDCTHALAGKIVPMVAF